jgi:hypothetical protein
MQLDGRVQTLEEAKVAATTILSAEAEPDPALANE